MTSSADPRDLNSDQRELLGLLEQVVLLPRPIDEDALGHLIDGIVPILEARGLELRGDEQVTITTLLVYERGLRRDGFEVAADGMQILILRWYGELEMLAAAN